MLFKQILHRSHEQDQQSDSFIASDAASTSKSLLGSASNLKNSTPPNITTDTKHTQSHEQRRTAAASTTKIDLNKPLPPLPTTRPHTEASEVTSEATCNVGNNNDDDDDDDDKSSKMSAKAGSALSSSSYTSSTTLLSNDNHHRHAISDASIAAILEKLTEGDREIITRALNSALLDPTNDPVAPSYQREMAGLEGRSSLWPSPATRKKEKENSTKTERRWLARWPWKSRSDGGKRSKRKTGIARDAASSASPSSRCPPSPAATAAGRGGRETAARTESTSPIGGPGTAAELRRNPAQGKRERSRRMQKTVLEEQALRQMRARTKEQTQAQALGTRALKTRERSPEAMDMGYGTEGDILPPSPLAPAL